MPMVANYWLTWIFPLSPITPWHVPAPATERHESTRQLGIYLRDIYGRNALQQNFRLFCPDETNSNRLGAVFEVENRCLVAQILPIDDHVAADGRVMEVLSEQLLRGLAGGLSAHWTPRPLCLVRSLRDDR